MAHDDQGRSLVQAVLIGQRYVCIHGIVEVRIGFDQFTDLLHFPGRNDFGNFSVDVPVLLPFRLCFKELRGYYVVPSDLPRRIGIARRHFRIRMLRKRKIAMDQPHFPGVDVFGHDRRQHVHVEAAAGRALIIRIKLERERSVRRAAFLEILWRRGGSLVCGRLGEQSQRRYQQQQSAHTPLLLPSA